MDQTEPGFHSFPVSFKYDEWWGDLISQSLSFLTSKTRTMPGQQSPMAAATDPSPAVPLGLSRNELTAHSSIHCVPLRLGSQHDRHSPTQDYAAFRWPGKLDPPQCRKTATMEDMTGQSAIKENA